MSKVRHSLRFRLAATFACFGAFISLLLSTGLFITVQDQGKRLMDETLFAEIEDMDVRLSRNPNALPPATISVRGYVLIPGQGMAGVPPEILALVPGQNQITIGDVPYRIASADKGNKRYVMLFNETGQRQREERFWIYWIVGTIVMTMVSGIIGWWLSGKVVSPVAELARRVDAARLEDESFDIEKGFPTDEIGKLAEVFGGYLRRMRAFSERERAFTADVSHEFRTPLAIIQGAVELLEDDERFDAKQKGRIARIGRAAKQMVDLTQTLLVMARENAADESYAVVERACDVWEVVKDAVDIHRYLLSANTNIELTCRNSLQLAVERSLLGIVVANLIRNALIYTETGKVSILLENQCLTVTDTGRGIPGEEVGKVFDRYVKGSDSNGEGIGLSLVKRICDRYGWKIVIESAPGKGTTAQLIFAAHSP